MKVALKIDVDTFQGTADGACRLANFLSSRKIPASFFVTLGPDTSGRAALRAFRHKGFLAKMKRTRAWSVYGLRTILSGTLLPARPIGTSFAPTLRRWRDLGFEVSPHGFDHIRWHDQAAGWDEQRTTEEWARLMDVYRFIFSEAPRSFAAPGWQAGSGTWQAIDKLQLLYHSDSRGETPYFPKVEGRPLQTLEIPTTMPTWDEMIAWDGVTRDNLVDKTFERLKKDRLNVWTIHAEFEGQSFFPLFHEVIDNAEAHGVEWVFLPDEARRLLANRQILPTHSIHQGSLPGRAGTVTCQISRKRDSSPLSSAGDPIPL